MKTVKDIYKIGVGPSSSHSMGPKSAAQHFLSMLDWDVVEIVVELYGSLAATGKGHLTDVAIESALTQKNVKFVWKPNELLPLHPNGLILKAIDTQGKIICQKSYYSVGGGDITDENGQKIGPEQASQIYKHSSVADIIKLCKQNNQTLWQYIYDSEEDGFQDCMKKVWHTMRAALENGLNSEQKILPGGLNLPRKSASIMKNANMRVGLLRDLNLLSSYALAVAEENASGGTVVTAPTCGSCGVLPAVLYYFNHNLNLNENDILKALATAGLFGTSVAHRASISGAEVGCQGEIGTACSMASAAVAQLMGGDVDQIEYAAEMGLEHFLGLTCDPVNGLVQVPCIERNAFAAMRALECASYALSTNGHHLVSFDEVVDVMYNTGKDMQEKYRETSTGGLAEILKHKFE